MTGVVRIHPGFSISRVGALVLRHWYLLRSSWLRLVELAYWPTVQMITWGFITQFFTTHSSWVAQAAGVKPPDVDPKPVAADVMTGGGATSAGGPETSRNVL